MKACKKISVVGGSGFVGTNLCQKLSEHQIPFEIIDIKSSRQFPDKYKFGDVRNIDSLQNSITGDVVVNLAAVHRDDVQDKTEYVRTNIDGAKNLAKVCSDREIRKIVFTSSVAVYGFAEPGTNETGVIHPFNDYGATKFKAEEELRAWQSSGNNQLIIIRPTVIFGEGNRGNVYNLFAQIASGWFVMIGSGTNRKSMAYIHNVVAFIEECIEMNTQYLLCNYSDTPDLDMNTLVTQVRYTLKHKNGVGPRLPYWMGLAVGRLADWFALVTGKRLPLSSIRVKKFCSETSFESTVAELKSFQPPFSLQEGIDRTLHSEFLSPDPRREIFYSE
jgi:nucleoside-diphosphate-sugar epimerase